MGDEMRKYEIALALGGRCGYREYLEVCTPTTGLTYARLDKEQFPGRARIIAPDEFRRRVGLEAP